jgi:hypothetical protein
MPDETTAAPAAAPAPAKPQNILELWDAVGAKLEKGEAPPVRAPRSGGAAKPATEAEPAAETPPRGAGGKFLPRAAAPAAAEKPAVTAPAADKKAQLEALAKELGFKLDGATVSVAERVQFREQRRKFNEATASQQAEFNRGFQAKLAELEAPRAAFAAWQAGDFDGFARALGEGDWNGLNRKAIQRHADPNYKLVQELRDKDAKREADEKAAKERYQREQGERATEQQIQTYKVNLGKQAAECADPVARAFADDPMFLDAVYRVQAENFVEGQDPLSIENAIRLAPRRGGSPLLEELRALYKRTAAAFADAQSDQAATKPESAQAGSTRAAPALVKKTVTSISTKKATEASAPVASDTRSKAWLKNAEERMLASVQEDKTRRRA